MVPLVGSSVVLLTVGRLWGSVIGGSVTTGIPAQSTIMKCNYQWCSHKAVQMQ